MDDNRGQSLNGHLHRYIGRAEGTHPGYLRDQVIGGPILPQKQTKLILHENEHRAHHRWRILSYCSA